VVHTLYCSIRGNVNFEENFLMKMYGKITQFKNASYILGSNINKRYILTEGKLEENCARLEKYQRK
jgi:hypothetical protein